MEHQVQSGSRVRAECASVGYKQPRGRLRGTRLTAARARFLIPQSALRVRGRRRVVLSRRVVQSYITLHYTNLTLHHITYRAAPVVMYSSSAGRAWVYTGNWLGRRCTVPVWHLRCADGAGLLREVAHLRQPKQQLRGRVMRALAERLGFAAGRLPGRRACE